MNLSDIDQGMYANFIEQLPDQGVFFIIGLNQLAGHFMLHVNADMAGMIVVRLLGGPGNIEKVERRLTELEINLLRGTIDKLLADLQDAWASVPAFGHISTMSFSICCWSRSPCPLMLLCGLALSAGEGQRHQHDPGHALSGAQACRRATQPLHEGHEPGRWPLLTKAGNID